MITLAPPAGVASEPFDYVAFHKAMQERFAALDADSERLAGAYRQAKPFPHIVLDDFLPAEVAEAAHSEFPGREFRDWTKLPTDDQRGKYALTDERRIPPRLRAVIQELNGGYFLRVLEKITGISELIADTKLVGGGLHRIEPGGKLSVHIDFSHHPTNGLNRRLNLLLYLNKDWPEEYGGHFEMWSSDLQRAERKILPAFNRCAIFSTSPISYHGHPEPLTCPEGRARQSIALYYFTKGRQNEEEVEHNTLFKSRPGDPVNVGNVLVRAASSGFFRDLIPPVLYRLLRKVWNRRFTGA